MSIQRPVAVAPDSFYPTPPAVSTILVAGAAESERTARDLLTWDFRMGSGQPDDRAVAARSDALRDAARAENASRLGVVIAENSLV